MAIFVEKIVASGAVFFNPKTKENSKKRLQDLWRQKFWEKWMSQNGLCLPLPSPNQMEPWDPWQTAGKSTNSSRDIHVPHQRSKTCHKNWKASCAPHHWTWTWNIVTSGCHLNQANFAQSSSPWVSVNVQDSQWDCAFPLTFSDQRWANSWLAQSLKEHIWTTSWSFKKGPWRNTCDTQKQSWQDSVKQDSKSMAAVKSSFCQTELEYLGYWITREGIQPMKDKVQSIMNLAEPKTRKELRSFMGLVNYYRDMWKRAQLLVPLNQPWCEVALGRRRGQCFKKHQTSDDQKYCYFIQILTKFG